MATNVLRDPILVILASVSSQELVERRLAAVKRCAIVLFGDWLIIPIWQAHDRSGMAWVPGLSHKLFPGVATQSAGVRLEPYRPVCDI